MTGLKKVGGAPQPPPVKLDAAAPPPPQPKVGMPNPDNDAFIGKVEKSPEFKKLDPATQKSADEAMRAATTPEARKNIADLVTSPGYGKLPPGSQDAALKALLKDPGNAEYAGSIKALVNNGGPYAELKSGSKGPAVKDMQQKLKDAGHDPGPIDGAFGPKTKAALEAYQKAQGLKVDGIAGPESLGELNHKRFSGLSEEAQKATLEKVANHPTDPAARETITNTALSPGFRQLDAKDQTKLLNVIGGQNVEISRPARDAMNNVLHDPKFEKGTPAEQKAMLEKFLADEPGRQGVLAASPGQLDATRKKYTLHGPTEVKDFQFKDKKIDALKYEVEIDGKKTPVYVPKNPDPKLKNHSIDEVAKGIAALPQASRDLVKQVNVEPIQNSEDPFWAKKYKTPGFHSYMTAGEAGIVNIYPDTNPPGSQDNLDVSLIHETGHILSQQKWGGDDDPRWKPWQDAMKADGVSASDYAKKAQGEDFSETLKLYQMVKGKKPQEDEMRALMPERFKIIDQLLAGK
ncbi:MAG: peptidoglycan-binding protein [Myxococcaceae bacterium]|nr:peptidoglycan-binding protein [Myxococcaceae bacterium]